MGASWHNNHHRYMNAARAGHRWWELDLTYVILWCLARVGLVWGLRPVPEKVLAEGMRSSNASHMPAAGGE
jgi:stearoyl-CoA desaturase (delta-9 desaturase)